MFGLNNKDPFEKSIILIGLIALFGIIGFASYKLVSKGIRQNRKEDSIVLYRVIDANKYGVIGKNGDEIVPCIYKAIGPFEEGLAVVVDQNGKYGYVRVNGTFAIPCRFERAYGFKDGWGRVCWNDKYYFIDTKGDAVFKDRYDYVYEFSDGIARIYQDGKFGFINKQGKPITPIVYDKAWDFEGGYATVIVGRDMYIIDKEGKRKTYNKYNSFESIEDNPSCGILAKKGGKWGLIDYEENVLLDFKYDEIRRIPDYSGDESYLLVKIDDKYGAYDYKGNCLIPPLYDRIDAYLGSFPSICVKDGKYGLARFPNSFLYEDIDPLWGGEVFRVKKGGLYGIVGKEGEVVIPIAYQSIWYEKDDGVYVVEFKDDSWGIINEKGAVVSEISFDDIDGFEEGLSAFCINDKYGYINKDGIIVIDAKYDDADVFSEGYAAVKLNGKYGYIDTTGRLISGFRYDSAWDFENGTAVVGIGDGKWLLDTSGELLTKRPYYFIGSDHSFPATTSSDYELSRKFDELMYDYDLNRR